MTDKAQNKESVTLKLENPFKWGDQEVTEIVIPRPTAKHMRGLNIKKLSEETDEMLALLQSLINEPKAYIDEMSFSDVVAAMGVVTDFLPSGQKTGASA